MGVPSVHAFGPPAAEAPRRSPPSRRSAATASSASPPASGSSAQFGFDEGVAGHITARDPELTDHFWVNPFGMNFRHDPRRATCILVNHHGEVVEGNWPVNQAAFAIHSADPRRPPRRRRRRPHPLALRQGVLVAAAGRSTPSPRTPARSTRTTPCSTTTPASCSTPRRASASPTPSATARPPSSRNHGLLTVGAHRRRGGRGGSSPWSARARPSSWPRPPARPVPIDDETARLTASQVGLDIAGWFSAPAAVRLDHRAPARLPRGLTPGSRAEARKEAQTSQPLAKNSLMSVVASVSSGSLKICRRLLQARRAPRDR